MKSRRRRRRASWTIDEFRRRHAISRAHLYRLIAAGLGPRILKLGNASRISRAAEADWITAHERDRLPMRSRSAVPARPPIELEPVRAQRPRHRRKRSNGRRHRHARYNGW